MVISTAGLAKKRKKKKEKKKLENINIALTASRYGSEFAADRDCEMRSDRHCRCRDESVISALSAYSVRQRGGQTS